LNGPAPLAVVENTAPSPTHRARLANAVAVVFENTVRFAQLVTLLQGPDTSTQYLPAEAAEAFDNVNWLFVWPSNTSPSFAHRKLNGPVPEGCVAKVAVPPGQTEIFASGVVLTLVITVTVCAQVLCKGPRTIAT
jgi:hypothetical protein